MDVDGHRKPFHCYRCGEPGHKSFQCSKPPSHQLRAADFSGMIEDAVAKAMEKLQLGEKKGKEDFPEGQQ